MKAMKLGLATTGTVFALTVFSPPAHAQERQQTDPQPACNMCQGTYLPAQEIQVLLSLIWARCAQSTTEELSG